MDPSECPRERLAEHGPEYLSSAEPLAIVLRTGTRHANAVDLAQALLTRFGGLTGLADADMTALTEVPGIGPAKATEIKFALEVGNVDFALD
jgi:DNA repair protein RadC